jgi:hypothetical protein
MFWLCGNVEEYKAYRLIPFTPRLLFHFTVPLISFLLLFLCIELVEFHCIEFFLCKYIKLSSFLTWFVPETTADNLTHVRKPRGLIVKGTVS